jgi:hypothetical protein
MQQEKFETAASLIQGEEETPSTPDPLKIVSPDKRKGSAEYYKRKYEQAQQIIANFSESSIVLEKTSVRVIQVHGSMRAQDVITKVKHIKR